MDDQQSSMIRYRLNVTIVILCFNDLSPQDPLPHDVLQICHTTFKIFIQNIMAEALTRIYEKRKLEKEEREILGESS